MQKLTKIYEQFSKAISNFSELLENIKTARKIAVSYYSAPPGRIASGCSMESCQAHVIGRAITFKTGTAEVYLSEAEIREMKVVHFHSGNRL